MRQLFMEKTLHLVLQLLLCCAWDLGFGVQGSGFRVQGSGFSV